MYTDEQAFCMHFEDMESCIQADTEIGLLNSSKALSLLLLEHLTDKVNKNLNRRKIIFEVVKPYWSPPGSVFSENRVFAIQSLDPYSRHSQTPRMTVVKLNVDKFLSLCIMQVGQEEINIHDYIIYLAINEGGRHKEAIKAKFKNKKALAVISKEVKVAGKPLALYPMKDILSISVRALRPVYEEVKASRR